jgi:hypothetical protein
MIVMGFVMTLKWDSLFPDRRDYFDPDAAADLAPRILRWKSRCPLQIPAAVCGCDQFLLDA